VTLSIMANIVDLMGQKNLSKQLSSVIISSTWMNCLSGSTIIIPY